MVYVSSLDNDSNNKRFGKVHKIIHLCAPGKLNKVSALCVDCAKIDHKAENAGFSFHLTGLKSGEKEIAGLDKYLPLCLKHHQYRSKDLKL